MNKTEQYQLNQWDAEDRILREDFNSDNANTEAALTGLQTALDAEKTSRVNAVNQLYGTKAEKTALTALETEMHALPFVLLKNITFNTAAAQVNVVVSDIDFSQYAYVLICPNLRTGENSSVIYMRLNSISGDNYYRKENTLAYMLSAPGDTGHDALWQIRMSAQTSDGGFRCVGETVTRLGEHSTAAGSIPGTAVNNSTLKTINFVVSAADKTIAAGSKVTIYGVKC